MPADAEPRTLNVAGLLLPLRETVVVLVTTFVLLLDYYRGLDLPFGPDLSRGAERLVLFLVVPLRTLLILRERPSAYGPRAWGSGRSDWRSGWDSRWSPLQSSWP